MVFLTGGINQQFVIGRPGISSRRIAGKKIGTVADGGIGDALVKFINREARRSRYRTDCTKSRSSRRRRGDRGSNER